MAVAEIKTKGDEFLQDRKKSNNLVELLELLQDDDNKTVIASMKVILKIFTHLLTTDKMKTDGAKHAGKTAKVLSAEDEYRQWLQGRYHDCIKCLCSQLAQTDSAHVQRLALTSLMKMLQTECKHPLRTNDKYSMPTVILHNVLNTLVSKTTNMKLLIGRFQEYLEYDDVRYETLLKLASRVQDQLQGSSQQADLGIFCDNMVSMLEHVTMPTDNDSIGSYLGRTPSSKECVSSLKEHKRAFTNTWLLFLRLPLPTSVYKRILIMLHESVMPHMTNPILLTDFLTESYNIGGAISLLALHGLFLLMSEYNLEYPEFYKKLYGLLDASVFHTKYRARFFHLADLFLTSTHIPAYLVAAFAKRLSRLALTAPSTASEMLIPFVCNLLMRHPTCQILVHNNDGPKDITEDPYIMSEPDPAKCHAMESSLWELETLKSHYYPGIATAARLIDRPFPKIEFDISEKLEITTEELITKEVKKKQKTMPLEYVTPKGLFDGVGFKDTYWEIS